MKKIVAFLFVLMALNQVHAQDSVVTPAVKKKKDWTSVLTRPKDHFMVQFGYNLWTEKTDTINTSGFPRSVNVYFLMDFPFKTDPRWSVAIGAGYANDWQTFKDTYIDITGSRGNRLAFYNVKDTNHFSKYRLSTSYLEAPLELRFSSTPERNMSSWKAALGVKIGWMVGAHTRGKDFVNKNGTTINDYVLKEKTSKYFNTTRLSVMGRIGWGIVSLYAAYQVNPFIKEGFGPDVRPLQFGVMISGL